MKILESIFDPARIFIIRANTDLHEDLNVKRISIQRLRSLVWLNGREFSSKKIQIKMIQIAKSKKFFKRSMVLNRGGSRGVRPNSEKQIVKAN